jgi:PAS domain S-box-containing protein
MQSPASEDEFLTLLDALAMGTDPMFALNDRNRIVFWNRGMHNLLGFEANEVMGKSCATGVAGDDSSGNRYCCEACALIQMCRRDETIRQFELTIKAKDGEAHHVDVTSVKFILPASKRFLLVHVVQPIARVEAPVADVVPIAQQGLAAAMRSSDARVRELTNRECEILGMLAGGFRPAEIAEQLCISPLTARNHIQRVFEKLEVHSQAEAVAFAYKMRLV